jgi:hypothetical protein
VAGSQRSGRARQARSSGVPAWAVVVAVVLALVPATWLAGQRLFDSPARSPRTASTDLPIPPESTGATPRTPSSTPASTPSSPAPDLPRITPDAPRRLVSGSVIDAGFDSSVNRLEPATRGEVARLGSRGSPGSPGLDTVVVVGEVFPDGGSAFGGLPRLQRGSTVSVRTDRGTLTYTVSDTTLARESVLAADPAIAARVPGRLVLVGIRYSASGHRMSRALVVTAQLTAAERG